MPTDAPLVAEQFDDELQQRDAVTLGMWLFLGTEVLFFGGLFLAYTVYRVSYPAAFREASNHTLILMGAVNTSVLLLSSFVLALAVHSVSSGTPKRVAKLLFLTGLLGLVFLAIKGFEYHHEISERLLPGSGFRFAGHDPVHAQMFFYLYFLMTGVHALHVTIGVIFLGIFAWRARRTERVASLGNAVDLLGLYWHFVDVVWVFLFPLIYLVGRAV